MMATELPEPESTTEAWNELARQSLLTHSLRQVVCGYQTHRFEDCCDWCGAAL